MHTYIRKGITGMSTVKLYKCAMCGKEYRSTAPNNKYCSMYCREQGRLESRSMWNRKHPEYYRQYMREYRLTKLREENDENKKRIDRNKKEA